MDSNYLFEKLKVADLQCKMHTEEFSVWLQETDKLFNWIEKQMTNPEMSSYAICSNVRKSIKILSIRFLNITKNKLDVTSVKGISIQDYLKTNNPGCYNFPYTFNEDVYKEVLKLEYVLLISKNETIFENQLKLIAFKILFNYFRTYYTTYTNETVWEISFEEVNNIVNSILSKDIEELLKDKSVKKIKNKLQLEYAINTALRKKEKMLMFEPEIKYLGKKPHNAQCIKDLWRGVDNEEELTQAAKMQLVMDRYQCSKSTAINYMKKFGLWVGRQEKKQSELDETETLKNRIKELEEEIKRLKS